MKNITICSYNLRMETSHDRRNQFTYRTPYIKQAIRRENPDIIGIQEALPHMFSWVKDTFTEYFVVGCGRGADFKDEANPVLFKKDKFEFLGYDMFWLSETPFVPGSRYAEQSGCPRVCVVVTLSPKGENRPFRIYNTHLDHISDSARKLGIRAIFKRMDEDDLRTKYPCLLLGDMNAKPNSETIKFITENPTRKFTELTANVNTTFHDYGRCSQKIDYIFASEGLIGENAKAWDDCNDGIYLSDHYPISSAVIL